MVKQWELYCHQEAENPARIPTDYSAQATSVRKPWAEPEQHLVHIQPQLLRVWREAASIQGFQRGVHAMTDKWKP